MLSRIGIHELRAVNDDVLQRLSPQTMVLAFAPFSEGNAAATADNLNKARARILQRQQLLPNTKLFIRWWDDDHRSRRMTPEGFAKFFALHIPGTLMLASNEDAVDQHDAAVYRETVAWWTECVKLATTARVTLAVGCMATGNPDYPQYAELVPLLRAMRDAARQGVVHWFYSNAYFDPADPGYREHHLERHQREVRKVCAAHKLPVPPMAIGEFGIAYEYKALEGYKARHLDINVYATRLCVESSRMDVPVNVYAAGDGILDARWAKFNIDHPDFWSIVIQGAKRVADDSNSKLERRYMDEARATIPPLISEPPDGFTWGLDTPKFITPKPEGANIRRAPDVNAPRILGIGERMKVKMFPNAWTNPDDKQVWRRIILASGTTGFVAESALAKIEDAPLTGPLPPLPPISPPPPPATPPPVVEPPPAPPTGVFIPLPPELHIQDADVARAVEIFLRALAGAALGMAAAIAAQGASVESEFKMPDGAEEKVR